MSAVMAPRLSLRPAILAFVLMAIGAALSWVLTPRQFQVADDQIDLEAVVPASFGDWTLVPASTGQVALASDYATEMTRLLYDQTVMRTYVNSRGDQIMLALAWGRHQRQEFKVHRPEVCYAAQGFQIQKLDVLPFQPEAAPVIPAWRMLASDQNRSEAVRYWIRLGNRYIDNGWQARSYIIREGLKGRIPDGILVRVSQIIRTPEDAPASWQVLDVFLGQMLQAVPPASRPLLIAEAPAP